MKPPASYISHRHFNLRYREALTASSLTVISAIAGISVARQDFSDIVAGSLVAILITSVAFVVQLLWFRRMTPLFVVALMIGCSTTWFALWMLTGYPFTSATILAVWVFLSYASQIRPEKGDDEIEELLSSVSVYETKLQLIEANEPIQKQLRALSAGQSILSKEVSALRAMIKSQKKQHD